jgi:2-polyprenyl-3-methyl-5-hydroxy-6-metoxy-1,4-benzoquinol methylase
MAGSHKNPYAEDAMNQAARKDLFAHKAGSYDSRSNRISNLDSIASTIIANVKLDRGMHLVDFGAGTGMLLERIAPHVRKITSIDVSPSMAKQLLEKKDRLPCELEQIELDLETADAPGVYDGVISSMTLHHIRDVEALLRKFHAMLKSGGFIALADLDREDGSFHTEETGVRHFGFERPWIEAAARKADFRDVATHDASVISKPNGDFPVFLLTARR